MSSLQFVVHPIPGTEDQLNDRFVHGEQSYPFNHLLTFGFISGVFKKIPNAEILFKIPDISLAFDSSYIAHVAPAAGWIFSLSAALLLVTPPPYNGLMDAPQAKADILWYSSTGF